MHRSADHISVRAFRAPDEPETCAQFVQEHARVLEDFGIENVNTNNSRWVSDPNCYVIAVEHAELGLVGGARIQTAQGPMDKLPMQYALEKLDDKINNLVTRLHDPGVGEICGLWNANRFAGRGMPVVLGLASISIANQIGLGSLVCVVAKYTLKYSLDLGFHLMEEVGNKGIFDAYPKQGFLGIVIGMEDHVSLDLARPDLRTRLLSLRMQPDQHVMEDTGAATLPVTYSLKLNRGTIDSRMYQEVRAYRLRYSA